MTLFGIASDTLQYVLKINSLCVAGHGNAGMNVGGKLFRFISVALVCLALYSCGKEKPRLDQLRILLWAQPTILNPNEDFDSLTDSVLFNVFEPLIAVDKDLKLKPALAAGWENPAPEIWRFHLRKDVRFHDGTPLNAEVVRSALADVARSNYETSGSLNSIKEFRIVDNFVIDLVTEKPSPILSRLAFVHIFKRNEGNFPPFLGTGPYKITRWDPSTAIDLDHFEEYWGGHPEFKSAQFKSVPEGEKRLQMLASGQADIIYSVPFERVSLKIPGTILERHVGLAVYYLGFNLKDDPANPFRDVRVRLATHMAIQRQRLIDGPLLGNGSIPTQPVAPHVFGFDPGIPAPEYNIEKAKALMAEAGYPEGFATQLDFTTGRRQVAVLLQDDLSKINIRINLNGLDRNEVYSRAEKGLSDFFLAGWDCSSGDAIEFYEFNLHSRGGTLGQGNYGNYFNREMDEITEKQSYVTDERTRKLMLQKAAKLAMQDLPILPLFIEDDVYAMKDFLYFEPRADGQIKLIDVKRRQ